MRKVKVKKLFWGKASVRDYIVDQAIDDDENVAVVFGRDTMILTPNMLKEGKRNHVVFRSRFDDQEYTLVDYDWKPNSQPKLL